MPETEDEEVIAVENQVPAKDTGRGAVVQSQEDIHRLEAMDGQAVGGLEIRKPTGTLLAPQSRLSAHEGCRTAVLGWSV